MLIIEILVTIAIITFAALGLYKNIKKKASGKCDCGCCSNHCSKYNSSN